MSSLPVTIHPITGHALFKNWQDTTGTADSTLWPADVENAEALYFDEVDTTNTITLFT